jgi:hypothetical protein
MTSISIIVSLQHLTGTYEMGAFSAAPFGLFYTVVNRNALIFSTSCEGLNGFLITPSIGADGKTASNSRLFTSNMVIIMTFILGRRSFTLLTS